MAGTDPRIISRRVLIGRGGALIGLSAIGALAGCTLATPSSTPTTPLAPTSIVGATASLSPTGRPTSPSSQTPLASPVAHTPTPTRVLRLATNHSAVELPWLRKALEAFTRARPGLAVEIENTTSGYLGQIGTWGAEGKTPDVVFTRGRHAAAWDYKGWIVPIDDWLRRDEAQVESRDLYPSASADATRDGRWLILPTTCAVTVLFGSTTVFQAADTELPREDWGWPELFSTARRVSKGAGGKGARWGLSWRPDAIELAAIWRAEDPGAVPDDGSGLNVEGASAAAVIQNLADLACAEGVAPTDADVASGAATFEAGDVAIEAGGSWSVPRYRATDNVSAVSAPPPRGSTGRRAAAVTTAGWAIGRDARDRDSAWQLVRHLGSRDAVDLTVTLPMRDLPARQSSAALWLEGVKAIEGPRDAEGIIKLAREAAALPSVPWWLEYQDACDELLPSVWAGQKRAAEVLPEVQRRVAVAARRFR